ncbi:MAG: putative flavoprotein [Mycobacterium sp.]|nr:putative flavoprotein [Mycobacterium sp.]MCW2743919.1 putative flavoprotein [Mycobacterium sp.]
MTARRRIAVVTAGLSQPSSTRLLADRLTAATTDALVELGIAAEVTVIDLRDVAHEVTDHLLTGFPPPRLRPAVEAVAEADGLIAVTPIFSGSFSGLFKMFFDVLEPGSLAGKPVLIAATAGTARHSLALEHALRPLFSYLRAIVVPTAVFAATEDWGATDGPGGELARRIDRAAAELAALVAARPDRDRPAAGALPAVTPFEELLSGLSG